MVINSYLSFLNKAISTCFELHDNLCRSVLTAHYVTSSALVLVPNGPEVCGCQFSEMGSDSIM